MSHEAVVGKNFKVTGGSITLLGMDAEVVGKNWMIGTLVTSDRYINIIDAPTPVLKDILSVIEADKANGDYDKIAAVVVSNRVAGRLFCEGILTRKEFLDAREGSIMANVEEQGPTEIPYIVLPSVQLGTHSFPLIIVSLIYTGYNHVCTVDLTNKIVGENADVHPLLPEPETMKQLLASNT